MARHIIASTRVFTRISAYSCSQTKPRPHLDAAVHVAQDADLLVLHHVRAAARAQPHAQNGVLLPAPLRRRLQFCRVWHVLRAVAIDEPCRSMITQSGLNHYYSALFAAARRGQHLSPAPGSAGDFSVAGSGSPLSRAFGMYAPYLLRELATPAMLPVPRAYAATPANPLNAGELAAMMYACRKGAHTDMRTV